MTAPAAFQATYADWKLIKTRGVVQVIFEVPLADHDVAYQVVGGMPDPARERWFGIAALQIPIPPAAKEKSFDSVSVKPLPESDKPLAGAKRMDWRDVQPAAQAGIRCDDPVFHAFLKEQYSDDWAVASGDAAVAVRLICNIKSRAELGAKHAARVIWHQLDSEFLAWKAVEHA